MSYDVSGLVFFMNPDMSVGSQEGGPVRLPRIELLHSSAQDMQEHIKHICLTLARAAMRPGLALFSVETYCPEPVFAGNSLFIGGAAFITEGYDFPISSQDQGFPSFVIVNDKELENMVEIGKIMFR